MTINRLKNWSLYALAWFPLVDYLLRKLPLIGAIWDKAVLIGLFLLAAKHFIEGERIEQVRYHTMLKWFIALGIAYIAMDLSEFNVAFDGFRAVYWYSFYVFILPFVVDRAMAFKLVKYLLYGGLLIALHGVYQYIVKTPIPSNWVDAGETVRTRVFSVFGSPNIMGSFMIFLFPTALGMAFVSKDKKQRLLFFAIALFSLCSLMFTYTRGAWLALFVALVFVSMLVDRRLLFLIVICAGLSMFEPAIHRRVAQLFSGLYWMKAAQDGRIFRWLKAYDFARYNPFFGTGLGHFGGAVAARYFNAMYADNYYAKTLAEMGTVGLGFMLTLFVTILRNLHTRLKNFRKNPNWPLVLGMYTSIVGILVQSCVENVFEVPAMNFLFWFYVTLALILTRQDQQQKASEQHASES